ncbi:flagellar biosynthetic protein FliO [Thermodesulfatator indicus DSM 15286]|uniref:Flagellar biosynthetic protein FliO n=1 Tax=Thermodesulfatator indicus (strain DSM 15286 / JCM 11887 / CIR29812) TaxID=667014 RepID=F8A9C6_THEID|nr:flagellar biosynthetic protein FliO [Thermodesulfatator indicus]AEH44067.1 flagellar biosynthetic protein FliO [Thermodesulfatator indicus DSM 15286]
MNELTLYLQVLGVTFILCALLVVGLWGLKRLKLTKGELAGEIKLLAYRPLNPKAQLALIEVFGEKMLIGLGENGPKLIRRWKKDEKTDA